MRLLVDSTVWVDFFRGKETAQTEKLGQCIRDREDICCCGFVLAEVLQGIREEKEYVTVKRHFENLILSPAPDLKCGLIALAAVPLGPGAPSGC